MKSRRELFALCAFLAIFLMLLPWPAGAVGVNETNLIFNDNSTGIDGSLSIVNLGTDSWGAMWYDGTDSFDLVWSRSTDGGRNWQTASRLLTTGDQGRSNHVVSAGGGVLAACAYNTTGGDLKFLKSTDDGAFWTESTVSTTDDIGGQCRVHAHSATRYSIVSKNATADRLVYVETTDGGGSWSDFVSLGASTATAFGTDYHVSGDTMVVAFSGAASALTACRSVDSGQSWSCDTTLGVDVAPALQFLGGSAWGMATPTSATATSFRKSTDDAVTWSAPVALPVIASGLTTIDLVTPLADTVIIVRVTTNGASCTSEIFDSTDAGASWSVESSGLPGGCSGSNDLGRKMVSADLDDVGDLVFGFYGGGSATGSNRQPRFARSFTGYFAQQPTASVAVTDMLGFEVDPFGDTVITRQGVANQDMKTYSGLTLGAQGTAATQCGLSDAAFSIGSHVAYIDCTAGDPDFFRIRTPSLTTSVGFECGGDTITDFSLNGFGHGDFVQQIQEVQAFPITYTQTDQAGLNTQCSLAWAFSTTALATNEVGIAIFNEVSNAPDDRFQATKLFGSLVHQVCTFQDDSGIQYLGGSGAGSTTRIWRVDFKLREGDPGTKPLEATIVEPAKFVSGSAHSGADALACSKGLIALKTTGGRLAVVNWTTGSELWNRQINGAVRGVAISDEFTDPLNASRKIQFVAYNDGNFGRVAYANNGTIVSTYHALPAAGFVGLEIDRFAQNVWQGNRTLIERFEVFANTTIVPVGAPGQEPGPKVESPGLFNPGGTPIAQEIAVSLGITTFGANLFMGAILMAFVSFGSATTPGMLIDRRIGWSWPAAGIGFVIGFLLAWGFGFFSTAVVASVIILGVLGAGLGFWFRRRE